MSHSIAITGSGIICSIGADKRSVLDALRDRRSGIQPIRFLQSQQALPVGEVGMSNDELKAALGVTTDADISRTTLLGAVALRQAMLEAGLSPADLDGRRVVFISGTTVGGMDVTERHYRDMLSGGAEAALVARHDCGSNSNEIAGLCGLHCRTTTISTACSSALNAIILGTRMLLSGEADIVIAGGSEALSRFHLNGFNSLLILDSERCRPFDATRRGLNLGEGAAYVVLERKDDADGRGAAAQGYVAGYGNRCDAYHQTATSADGEGAFLAMGDALAMSGMDPGDIDYINAHGTGTPDNDRSESAAVRRLFGRSVPPVSSTKSLTGHTTSASGSIEAVICLLAMHNSLIPANVGWTRSDDDCLEPSTGAEGRALHHVLCNSFGFGGNDSSLVLSDHPVPLPDTVLRQVRTAAESEVTEPDELKELRQFVPPMESRRMSQILKGAVLTSMRALQQAGVDCPDAIIVATQYGMLDQGEKILDHITQIGEDGISPTAFMQSTHNTIAGSLAIRLGCHGYNITYSQGDDSLSWALSDARRLISEGRARNVLVGLFDQCPPKFRDMFASAGLPQPPLLLSQSMIISTTE